MGSFKVNDKVIHFREGLATIVESKEMNGLIYFLVQLEREASETIFVPEKTADAIIRHVIDKAFVNDVIKVFKDVSPEYITNTKQRRDNFKRRLSSGNILDLAFLAKQLYYFQHPEVITVPVKFGPADLDMLRHAHSAMLDELEVVLKKPRCVIEENFFKLVRA